MNEENKKWIEKVLSDLPFVNWDRLIDINFSRERIINIFGWIDREKDSYKDFVCLEFNLKRSEVYFISTSSKKYSKEIADILGSKHIPCNRVQYYFNIKNKIVENKNV